MEKMLRGIAGVFILLSIVLTIFVNPLWVWFTVFIGLNLLQSSFTNWCPMMWILEKIGLDSK